MKFETSMTTVSFLAIAVGAAALIYLNFIKKDSGSSNQEAVGTVIQKDNSVKQKFKNSLNWNSLLETDKVYYKDTIFVENDSTLKLKLNDNSILEIGPDSLLVLDIKPSTDSNNQFEAIEIKLEKGNISVKQSKEKSTSNQPKPQFKIKLDDNSQVNLENSGDLVVSKKNDKVSLYSTKGKVSLENVDSTGAVKGTKEISSKAGSIQRLDLKQPQKIESLKIPESTKLESNTDLSVDDFMDKMTTESVKKPKTPDPFDGPLLQEDLGDEMISEGDLSKTQNLAKNDIPPPEPTPTPAPIPEPAPPPKPKRIAKKQKPIQKQEEIIDEDIPEETEEDQSLVDEEDPTKSDIDEDDKVAENEKQFENQVSESTTEIPEPLPTEERRANYRTSRFWASAGAGVNYNAYSQTSDVDGDNNFATLPLDSPTLLAEFGRQFNEIWTAAVSYHSAPGVASSGTTNDGQEIIVEKGRYNWTAITGEGRTELKYGLFSFGGPVNLGVRYGVQYHTIPFLVSKAALLREVKNHTLLMASAGFELSSGKYSKWSWEFFLRYQYPLQAKGTGSDTITVKPGLTFDGSLGSNYYVTDAFWLGGYWYGQLNQYNYNYFNSGTGSSTEGSQNLLYSNIELRGGYDF